MALLAIVYGDRGANMTLVSHAEYFIATVFIKSTYNLADFITSRGLLRKKKITEQQNGNQGFLSVGMWSH